MSEPPNREVAVLNAALDLPPAERAAYLEKTCAEDASLRQRVEALLQAYDQADDFLNVPPPGLDFNRTEKSDIPMTEKSGDKIGRYKLLQQIGEGGCGVVYMADQEEPVRRRVALKVIKLGMDTKQVIARFDAERQALAMMDHPNIAKVLDAGATETGRPYFVMELVRGVRITEFCDDNKLSTADRLKLFIQVCHAIQHAHQKGVIHRDIKPSNILVTINDGVPVPKVIDFGIAKATAGRLTDETLFTAFEQFLGTPAYMSPEQAVMTSLDIDTRSDIYSLGVLLYELLTGKTPFDQKELFAAGWDAMRRTIREEEPPRPSTRLSTLAADALRQTAIHRQTDAPKLLHAVRGDLDWIVMKCLEKDRVRRYETANGLASDITRHLDCEPVAARPPSRLYEFQKTVRRHKFGFAAASAVLLALLLGLGFSTWTTIKERRARQRAVVAERKSESVAQLLKEMLEGVSPSVALGRDRTMLEDILKGFAERVAAQTNEPGVQAELYETLAYAYHELEQYDGMEKMSRKALGLNKTLFGDSHPAVAKSMTQLGDALRHENDLAQAEPLLRDGVAMYLRLVGTNGQAVDAMNDLGQLYHAQNRLSEAEGVLRQAWENRRQLAQAEKDVALAPLHNLTLVLQDQRRYSEVEQLLTNAIVLARASLPGDHPQTVRFMKTLGEVYRSQGRYSDAEEVLTKVMEASRRIFGEEHRATLTARNALALVFQDQGHLDRAEPLISRILEAEKRRNPESPETLSVMNNLAVLYLKQRRYDRAESHFTILIGLARSVFGTNNPRTLRYSMRLAAVFREQKRFPEAEALLTNVLSSARSASTPDDYLTAKILALLAETCLDVGRWVEAEKMAADCLVILDKESPDSWETFSMRAVRGRSLLGQKDHQSAEPILRKACEGMLLQRSVVPPDSQPALATAIRSLIELYKAINRSDEAAEWEQKLKVLEQAK
jgi:serine/threonine protein kinase/tetratricopeptide (TPR) repeat protein